MFKNLKVLKFLAKSAALGFTFFALGLASSKFIAGAQAPIVSTPIDDKAALQALKTNPNAACAECNVSFSLGAMKGYMPIPDSFSTETTADGKKLCRIYARKIAELQGSQNDVWSKIKNNPNIYTAFDSAKASLAKIDFYDANSYATKPTIVNSYNAKLQVERRIFDGTTIFEYILELPPEIANLDKSKAKIFSLSKEDVKGEFVPILTLNCQPVTNLGEVKEIIKSAKYAFKADTQQNNQ